jgi:peptide/nickel transport system substrate-binding protein
LNRLRSVVLAALAAVVAAASIVPQRAAAHDRPRHPWTQPGVLRIGVRTNPRTLNPLLVTSNVEMSLARLTNDVLVTADENGKLIPSLAAVVPTRENGGISQDGRTITYHLRHDVKWHDGVPFTSADVAFSFAAVMNPKNVIETRDGFDRVTSVTTPDPYTAVFHYRAPYAPAIATVFGDSSLPYCIVPKHLLARYPNLNDVPFNSAPIGTGPFRFVRWNRSDEIVYEANPQYFKGAPKLKRIVVKLLADENTTVNQLRSHEIDWAFEGTIGAYRDLKDVPNVVAQITPTNGFNHLQVQTQHEPFDDVRVRRAISLALDRDTLTRTLALGAVQPANVDFPPFLWAHDASIPPTKRDLAKANALLDAAGLPRGADGMRTFKGKPLAIDFVYQPEGALGRREVVVIQAQLRDVGLDVRPRAVTSSLFLAPAEVGGVLRKGNFDISLVEWTAGVDPDDSTMLTCANLSPSGYNEERYCSKTMDAAQARALGTFDQRERKAAYSAIERELVDQAPLIPIFWIPWIEGLSDDVRGVHPNPAIETWNAWQWSI